MLPAYTLLDLETTGGTPLKDRITEIGLIRYENDVEVLRWAVLLNPECKIPLSIQNFTGITNNMVAEAPVFKEIADELLAYLEGTILVAHNARFDYGFLKSEFLRIGHRFHHKLLCTVKLSRALYPEQKSHGLDSIMRKHNLMTEHRHRAMGDAELMAGFIASAIDEHGLALVQSVAKSLINTQNTPINLDQSVIDSLPIGHGVYLFYGDNRLPLYIGKSINIRERVTSHFSADHASTKEMNIAQEVKSIEHISTAGELGALLMEAKLVKELQPIYNRRLRREGALCAWKLADNAEEVPQLKYVGAAKFDANTLNQLYGVFMSRAKAVESLDKIVSVNQLCARVVGLEKGDGACFGTQVKKCKGACCNRETLAMHFIRLQQALVKFKLKSWPYSGRIAIREHDEKLNLTQLHIIDQWSYVTTLEKDTDFDKLPNESKIAFDLDSYKLLSSYLRKNKGVIYELDKLAKQEPEDVAKDSE